MDFKRKAMTAASASPDDVDRASKRRKLPNGNLSNGETPESTMEYGLRFLEQARQAKDKRGRPVATNFLTLPDRDDFPDYYQAIVMPLALDTIETKLLRKGYPTLTTLESDVKRMVANAKSYNEKTSEIFADAERIRKMVSHFMSKNNPAYKDPNYTAFPTPLDGETEPNEPRMARTKTEIQDVGPLEVDGHGEIEETGRSRGKSSRAISIGRPSQSKIGQTTTAPSGPGVVKSDFSGKSFQAAQEQIVADMINLKDDDDQEVSQPFHNLPARKLTDYYALIRTPESLKRIEKKVRGVHGRNDPTGISDFKTWRSFEEHVSLIWRNAREYNEDGSEISNLADNLEAYFKSRVAEAKSLVPDLAQLNGDASGTQRLKLKMSSAKSPDLPPQKIMLRVGGGGQKPASPGPNSANRLQSTPHDSGLPGGAVDDGALQRQRTDVQAGVNGQGRSLSNGTRTLPRDASAGSRPGSASATPALTSALDASAPSPALSATLVKSESALGRSPSLGAARLGSGASEDTRLHQAVLNPGPASALNQATNSNPGIPNGHSYPPPMSGSMPHQSSYGTPQPQATGLESRWRAPGKDASDALISNVSIFTHPGLKLSQPFRLDILPSATTCQQSITLSLPSTHYYLQIVPTIAPIVTNRQSKLFVSAGLQRLNATPQMPNQSDSKRPLYEVKLMPGVNRIEVEMIVGPIRGAPKVGPVQEIEMEKVSIFVNLLRP